MTSACLREQRVEHFADHALASAQELADAFELLLNLRHRPAHGWLGFRGHQILNADAECLQHVLPRRRLRPRQTTVCQGDGRGSLFIGMRRFILAAMPPLPIKYRKPIFLPSASLWKV